MCGNSGGPRRRESDKPSRATCFAGVGVDPVVANPTQGFPGGGVEIGAGEAAVDVVDVLGFLGPAFLALWAGGEEGLAEGGVFLGLGGTLGRHGAEAGAFHRKRMLVMADIGIPISGEVLLGNWVNARKFATLTAEAHHDSPVVRRPCFDASAVHAERVGNSVPEKTHPPNKAMHAKPYAGRELIGSVVFHR